MLQRTAAAGKAARTNHAALLLLAALAIGCSDGALPSERADMPHRASIRGAVAADEGPHAFSPAVFDIDAAPDGSMLVAQNTTVQEIRLGGIHHVADVPAMPGTSVNGLASIGRGSFFATTSATDLAMGAGVWHVTRGRARLVGDIEAFETAFDPDAFEGPQWKNQACEEDPSQGFSAGPQSNPYHLARRSGSSVLVADAAGNTLLLVSTNGRVEWVAVFTPPVDENGDWRVLGTAHDDPSIECYVQPVPTSVAIGPDGAYYVGELTGAPAVPGWSRVWRIEPGSHHVVCPSADCTVVVDGLTSIIDVAFGRDGLLYVVEYDGNGWLAVLLGAPLAGGTLRRCDVSTGSCDILYDELMLPSAITFDRSGGLWLLESNIIAPTVRRIDSD